jgi:hypothetical protein
MPSLIQIPSLRKISVWIAIRAVKGVLFRPGTPSRVSFINRFAHIIRTGTEPIRNANSLAESVYKSARWARKPSAYLIDF